MHPIIHPEVVTVMRKALLSVTNRCTANQVRALRIGHPITLRARTFQGHGSFHWHHMLPALRAKLWDHHSFQVMLFQSADDRLLRIEAPIVNIYFTCSWSSTTGYHYDVFTDCPGKKDMVPTMQAHSPVHTLDVFVWAAMAFVL